MAASILGIRGRSQPGAVFTEGGGLIPDRNVERTLSSTHVPVPAGDSRRLDLIVPCTNVARGLPLFCDITVVSPIQRTGAPRPGTSNQSGGLLERAENENNDTYREVLDSGLGVYYAWGQRCMDDGATNVSK